MSISLNGIIHDFRDIILMHPRLFFDVNSMEGLPVFSGLKVLMPTARPKSEESSERVFPKETERSRQPTPMPPLPRERRLTMGAFCERINVHRTDSTCQVILCNYPVAL